MIIDGFRELDGLRSVYRTPTVMKLKNKKVTVCGAGGFIGGHLVNSLFAGGAAAVRAIDIKPLGEWYQASMEAENLVLDLKDLQSCMTAAAGTEVVFQLAP